ncbi:type II toxin-antitoxin system VapC family toxin [Candidatus Daviesbacteria bacterium]|nr:type II toxin-antitoxin system VapC family toxin [Candidatus Daviesbacteria bacterium]
MSYLVDTHIFLWSLFSPKKISKKIIEILIDPKLTKVVSSVTFWEISLKYQLGKLDLTNVYPDQLPGIAKNTGFEILSLDADIASSFFKLPKLKNQDPFDRMLIWQAISKDYTLLTQNKDFALYQECGLKII